MKKNDPVGMNVSENHAVAIFRVSHKTQAANESETQKRWHYLPSHRVTSMKTRIFSKHLFESLNTSFGLTGNFISLRFVTVPNEGNFAVTCYLKRNICSNQVKTTFYL